MDVGGLIKLVAEAGPSVGIGLAAGLLIMISGLGTEKLVMGGRFTDMREQRNKLDKEYAELKTENRSLSAENSELRIMVAGALTVVRKSAQLNTAVMRKAIEAGVGKDD